MSTGDIQLTTSGSNWTGTDGTYYMPLATAGSASTTLMFDTSGQVTWMAESEIQIYIKELKEKIFNDFQ